MVLIGTGALTLAIAAVYMAPTLLACQRKAPSIGWILAINVLLGWTVFFWGVALVLALRDRPQPVQVQVFNSPPPLPPSWQDHVLRGTADPPGRQPDDTLPDEDPDGAGPDWPPFLR